MPHEQTEKPTQKRLDKAREEGNLPSSREFVSATQFVAFVALASGSSGAWFFGLLGLMRGLLRSAFAGDSNRTLTVDALVAVVRYVMLPPLIPLFEAGAGLVAIVVGVQLASTRFGLAPAKLIPDFKRLSIFNRIKNLPAQNVPVLLQAMALLPLVALVVYYEVKENLGPLLGLPWVNAAGGILVIATIVKALLWRAAGLFVVAGLFDLWWQHSRYQRQLRMSKQEIRDENKEQQGNPQMKMRIRRIQRDMARRRMLQEVPKATAVIVNPTHYAVAIRYSLGSGGAPKVVAKGKNYLAKRIRKIALENQVPIVENPPLAQALYAAVEPGQEIPSSLYRAVAEILAYIYKLMGGRLPG